MKQPTIIELEESPDANKKIRWDYPNSYIVPSKEKDAERLGPKLRKADKDEIQAAVGEDPVSVLKSSIRLSNPGYTVKDSKSKKPLACFGAAPYEIGVGVVWFLSSETMFKKNRIQFIRSSKFWVEKLFEHYDVLFNVVDSRNKVHIRWLKWMNFRFIADIPEFGAEKRMFHQFVRSYDD